MPRNITFTQEQKELVALLPNGLPKMTDGAKLVLSNIINWYGTEFAKENGYIFRSDSDMKKDTGVGENTVKRAIRELETKGLFEKVKRGVFGDRKNGTEFYLSEEIKEKIHFKPTELTQANNSISQANNSISQANNETERLTAQMNTILMKLNELSEENKQLREKIDRLEKNFIGLTDTDTESLNNNYTTGTSCTGTCCKGNKKESILTDTKEKPEETCDEYIQPPARPYFFDPRYFGKPAEKRTEAKSVSSSLQLIEEENHPDTNNPSDDDLIQADRLNLSQSFSKTQPQPLDKGKCIEETLGDINPYIRMWLSELSDYDVTVTDDYVDENVLTPLLKAHPDYFSCDDDERYKTTCEIRVIIKGRMEGALRSSYWRNAISMNSDVVTESATAYRDAS